MRRDTRCIPAAAFSKAAAAPASCCGCAALRFRTHGISFTFHRPRSCAPAKAGQRLVCSLTRCLAHSLPYTISRTVLLILVSTILVRFGSPRISASANFAACDARIFAGIGGVYWSTAASMSTGPGRFIT